MTERKLASIRKISALRPIKDADKIEVASIDGWDVVVQKGLHNEGDLVVYFEIDSLLPEIPEFEFLRKNCYVKETNSVNGAGFRLRTIKLRGQVSQGLVMPLREVSQFVELDDLPGRFWYEPKDGDKVYTPESIENFEITGEMIDDWFWNEVTEGLDVTEILNVKKYEKPIPANLAGKIRGNFPSFIRKTDQERIQNFIPNFKNKYSDHEWEVSLKLDGSSMTVYYYAPEDRFGVCSRNLDLKETDDNAFWNVARKLDLENKLRFVTEQAELISGKKICFALQGELIGPGVQGNRENLSDLDFYVFDVWDITNQCYMHSEARIKIVQGLGLKHVPVYGLEKFSYTKASDFLELAEFGYGDGKSLNNPIREGLVFKSLVNPNVSFKAISNKYLLSGGE